MIRLQQTPFDPVTEQHRHAATLEKAKAGAVVTFTGTMRDMNEGREITSLHLEHYPGMTEKQLEKLCQQARDKWQLIDMLVVHRVGTITPGEPIVLICVWSEHRADAFDACRFLINSLKTTAPFWKSETGPKGTGWVETNTPDDPQV